jgi:hypothetical protein
MHIFFAIFAIFPIALYKMTVVLNVFFLIMAIICLVVNIVLFVFVKKIGKYEREKMLPLSVLVLHAKEYTEDYNKKLKEIIGDDNRE